MFNDMLGFSKEDVKYLMTEIDITEENIKYIKYHRKNVFIEK